MSRRRHREPVVGIEGQNRAAGTARPALVIGILASLVLGVYLQIIGHDWVHWDDDTYVFANPNVLEGLSAASARWALIALHGGTWQPVTWVSYLVDASLHGPRPGWFHLTSLLLHLANAILLFEWLRRLTGATGRSAFVAAVFAVHPVNTEAVAWIAARKDLLAAMFAFLSLLAYRRYAIRPSVTRGWPVLGVFVLGLASKPVVMTLPALLLLLDIWPLRRIVPAPGHAPDSRGHWRHVVLEKLPLLALSLASLAVTFLAQHQAGTVANLNENPLGTRLANAACSYVAYIGMLFIPARLACFYPYVPVPAWQFGVSLVLLAGITTLAVRLRRRCPAVLLGWAWYVVALLPTIGFVQVGSHARADRFLYLPMIGIAIATTWGIEAAVAGRQTRGRAKREADVKPGGPPRPAVLLATAGVILLALALVSFRQAAFWKNDTTLFGHAARVTRGNYLAENKFGATLGLQGRMEEARTHFVASLRMSPRFIDALINLGAADEHLGRPDEAIRSYRRVLEIDPGDARARRGLAIALNNLGAKAANKGQLDDALDLFRQATEALPSFEPAQTNLRRALAARAGAAGNP